MIVIVLIICVYSDLKCFGLQVYHINLLLLLKYDRYKATICFQYFSSDFITQGFHSKPKDTLYSPLKRWHINNVDTLRVFIFLTCPIRNVVSGFKPHLLNLIVAIPLDLLPRLNYPKVSFKDFRIETLS